MKYLHTMIRVSNPAETIRFFEVLGLKELRRMDSEQGRFTLIFLAAPGDEAAQIELTHNWDEAGYGEGRNFGHVAYRVDNTREGQVLDYDKLIIEVETNGAIRPEDAIAYAARILQDQLQVFITFEEPKAKKEGGVGQKVTGINSRTWRPNLQKVRVVEPDGTVRTIRVCARYIKAGKFTKASRGRRKALRPA